MSGIDTETTTDTGGGTNVGWIDTGDWMTYENAVVNIPTSGQYVVSYRVASEAGGGSFNLYETSTNTVYDTVSIGATGAWQNWVTIKRVVVLSAGKHTFGIKAVTGGFNLNWFKVETTASAASSSSSAATSSTPSSSGGGVSSASSSSAPATTGGGSLSSSSVGTSSNSSSSVAGVISTLVAGPVGMSWIAPSGRMDGTLLDITEIGGYEIRYRLASSSNFTYISINDAWTTQYNFAWLEGNYVFQVAAFDKNGIYSNFVDVVSAN